MKNRKDEDYSRAKRGSADPVSDDRVHDQVERDHRAISSGKHSELATDTGVREQGKAGKGY